MKNTDLKSIAALLLYMVLAITGTESLAQRAMLRATVVSYQQVDLSWDRLPGIPEAYIVERKEDGFGQNFAAISGTLPGSTMAYQDKTVQENRSYVYRVVASCDKSCGGELNEVRVTTPVAPPAAPGSLEAFYISGRGMSVTWLGNNGGGTEFLLERSDNGGPYAQIAVVPYARALSYGDANVSPGNRYCYRVKARNAGGESGYSNEGCASIVIDKPAAPSGLSASAVNARQIALSWTDNAGNETGFEIERSQDGTTFSKIGDAGANAGAYQDMSASPRTKYWYRVLARNGGGTSGYSNIADATTPDVAPDAPANLNASPVSNTQINITWNDISGSYGNETGYELEKSNDGNTFEKIADLAADVTSYSNTGLSTLTRYWYRLRAKNAQGYSPYSSVVEATTFDVPPIEPSNLSANAVSAYEIELGWKDNSANETAFEVERSTDGNSFEKIGETGPNATGYQSGGLAPATKYWYRVRAKNSVNPSAYTNVADATTKDVAPNAPRGLQATAVSYQQVDLAWTDASGNETGFEVEISANGTAFSKLGTTAANVAAYQSKGLKELTTYYYRVRAVNAIGNSDYSEVAQVRTPKAPIPDKPNGLTATPVDYDFIQLKWAALSPNAETVIIERSRKPDADFERIGTQEATKTQFADREILDVYDYYYRIRAANSAGASPYSDVVKVAASAIITATEPASQQNAVYAYGKTLHVSLSRAARGRLLVYNAHGTAVQAWPLSQKMSVSLDMLPAGIYIAVVESDSSGPVRTKLLLY